MGLSSAPNVIIKQREAIHTYVFHTQIIAMELRRQVENAEAESLISSFGLNVPAQYPDDAIATAFHEQELAQQRQRANQVLEERQWKEFYEDSGAGRYVT
jgi:hypothetical protein